MSDVFDPYYKWLGISPKDQPPHHYRLLGVDLFEPNADVIANAADQRMAHLRSFQAGKNGALSQQLLNEIAAARVCLLHAQKKFHYDQWLQSQLESVAAVEDSDEGEVVESLVDIDYAAARPAIAKKKSSTPTPWVVAGVVAAAAVVLLVVIVQNIPKEQKAVQVPTTTPPPPLETPKPPKKPNEKGASRVTATKGTVTNEVAGVLRKAELRKTEENAGEEETADNNDVAEKPIQVPFGQKVSSAVNRIGQKQPGESEASDFTSDRLAVPDDETQEKVRATVREVYRDQYKVADKYALVRRLLKTAEETNDDAATRYVLLQEAVNVAAEAGDAGAAFRTIDVLAGAYDVSALTMKAEIFEKLARRTKTVEQKTFLAEMAINIIDDAIGAEDFDAAKKVTRQAGQLARACKAKELLPTLAAKHRDVELAATAFADAKDARKALGEKPDDPTANTAIGKYLCLVRGDWGKGLPYLAKGRNEKIALLAERDMEGANTTERQVALGDAWWDVCKGRAVYWYEMAAPLLSGLQKTAIEKKLVEAKASPSTIVKRRTDHLANTVKTKTSKQYLAEIPPVSYEIHRGVDPVRGDGEHSIRGNRLEHGLWAHPPAPGKPSTITMELGQEFRQLTGLVGIADRANPKSPLTFRIDGDGKTFWKSQPLKKAGVTEAFRVRVDRVKQLTLVVECPGSHDGCWALWIDPELTRK